ncbi:hypothetical protein KC354_g97 [Hortaea werneckii]|nr:hypothetical protein KC354_g97 [Hortaea werneckii]
MALPLIPPGGEPPIPIPLFSLETPPLLYHAKIPSQTSSPSRTYSTNGSMSAASELRMSSSAFFFDPSRVPFVRTVVSLVLKVSSRLFSSLSLPLPEAVTPE